MGRLLAAGLLAAAVPAQPTPDFAADVLPILERSCARCHGAPQVDERGRTRQPKGSLRLDGQGWILAGGKSGPAVVAGEPDRSPLWQRISLAADDRDRMPQRGEPLPRAEQDLIRRWIAAGAAFGGWTGAGGPEGGEGEAAPGDEPARVRVWEVLARGLAPVSAAAVAHARDAGAQIEPVAAGSPLLRVAFRGADEVAGDDAIEALRGLRGHIAVLELAHTAITDRALDEVRPMPRLTHLDLRATAVSDRGAARLAALPELRYLNLYGTAVTDRGLAALAELRTLAAVHVWQTGVTPAGAQALRDALPGARVVLERTLPEPAAEEESGGAPRQRR